MFNPYPLFDFHFYSVTEPVKICLANIAFKKEQLQRFTIDQYKLVGIKEQLLSKTRENFVKAINVAAQEKADFICFGEFAYPRAAELVCDTGFATTLSELSTLHNLIIIAGSAHLRDAPPGRRFNSSLIFFPNNENPLEQQKLKIAETLGEFADHGSDTLKVFYHPKKSDFAVVICLTAAYGDLRSKLRTRNSKRRFKNVPLVFLPAFEDNGKMLDAAESISKMDGACVAYINSMHGSDHMEEQLENNKVFAVGARPIMGKTVARGLVTIYDLEPNDFQSPIKKTPVKKS